MAKSKSTVRTEFQLHRSAIRLSHKGDPAWESRWAWERIMDRIVYKRGGRNKCYANIELRMTRDEFLEWAIPAYTAWMAEHPGETPSVDRIESDKHYEIGNLRVLEHVENSKLSSHHKNLKAPEGMAWCSGCQEYLSKELFYIQKRYQHGVSSDCRECVKARSARRLKKQQSTKKTRDTKIRPVICNGTLMSVADASRITGVPAYVIRFRLDAGWDDEKAISTPVAKRIRHTT